MLHSITALVGGLALLLAQSVHATATLNSVCTVAYAKAALPVDPFGLTINRASITAAPITNSSVSDQDFYPDATFSYCNVTFSYTHNGKSGSTLVNYWMPAPASFKNRYLSTGGGGLAINSGDMSLPGGIIYGAVAGKTDGGFGGFNVEVDAVYLSAPGSINYDIEYAFGYTAHHELSIIGKAFTKLFFKMRSTKLYSYYQACSEGGREGFSQVQRFGEEWDGAAIGAPALRYSFQQANHLTSNVIEKTMKYYPSPCELEKIVNVTISACDALDGKKDGVVARTDLCALHFDIDQVIGEPYYCAAVTASSGGMMGGGPPSQKSKRQIGGSSASPAQKGTVTAKGVAVAKAILAGLKDSQGQQVYLSYQPSAAFTDAQTQYNSTTKKWELEISGLGGEWVTRFLQLQNSSTLATLDGIDYDGLRDLMVQGLNKYSDSLQTDWPDLTPFNKAGGKIIHFHGESDYSIPTASSVRYWTSVRDIMYPNMTFTEANAAINDWYRLYLVQGGSHCAPNAAEPNGPWPQTSLANLIDWVEHDIVPTTLNATVLQGTHKGDNQQICTWPLRPLWKDNVMDCVFDQESYDTWQYDLTGVKLPVY